MHVGPACNRMEWHHATQTQAAVAPVFRPMIVRDGRGLPDVGFRESERERGGGGGGGQGEKEGGGREKERRERGIECECE